mgnify:FL=1
MNLKYYDSVFTSSLSSDVCNRIIKYGVSQQMAKAKTGNNNTSTLRDSEIVWLFDSWIYDLLQPYIEKANQVSEWNFQYESADGIQFTKYGVGQYYDWHQDSYIPPQSDGKIRKLSVTVNLNDDYEGGEFFLDTESIYGKNNPIEVVALKPKGSICVFPSDVWHKVDKVTKGIRYSLVVWLSGEAWR